MDEGIVGWAKVPGHGLWHRVRAVAEADTMRATTLHGACGMTFRSNGALQYIRSQEGPICRACSMADDAEQGPGHLSC